MKHNLLDFIKFKKHKKDKAFTNDLKSLISFASSCTCMVRDGYLNGKYFKFEPTTTKEECKVCIDWEKDWDE